MTDKPIARRVAAAHERMTTTIKRCMALLKDAEDNLAAEVGGAKAAGIAVHGLLVVSGLEGHNFASRQLEMFSAATVRVSRTVDLA